MDADLKASIDAVHRHICDCAHRFLKSLIMQSSFSTSIAHELLAYTVQLSKLLPAASVPNWLTSLLKFRSNELRANHIPNECSAFASFVLSNLPKIEAPILTPEELSYNFDVAFDVARESQDIAGLFGVLVSKLEAIIATDLIDSRVVQEALERLKALLLRNKHGSLTSIIVSMHYGRFVLKAFAGALSANPYLKPMVESFKEEFAIAESKVRNAETSLKLAAVQRLTNEERLMAYLAEKGANSTEIAGYLGRSDTSD